MPRSTRNGSQWLRRPYYTSLTSGAQIAMNSVFAFTPLHRPCPFLFLSGKRPVFRHRRCAGDRGRPDGDEQCAKPVITRWWVRARRSALLFQQNSQTRLAPKESPAPRVLPRVGNVSSRSLQQRFPSAKARPGDWRNKGSRSERPMARGPRGPRRRVPVAPEAVAEGAATVNDITLDSGP
jgi:hypothetical protein